MVRPCSSRSPWRLRRRCRSLAAVRKRPPRPIEARSRAESCSTARASQLPRKAFRTPWRPARHLKALEMRGTWQERGVETVIAKVLQVVDPTQAPEAMRSRLGASGAGAKGGPAGLGGTALELRLRGPRGGVGHAGSAFHLVRAFDAIAIFLASRRVLGLLGPVRRSTTTPLSRRALCRALRSGTAIRRPPRTGGGARTSRRQRQLRWCRWPHAR